jgi:broad specificity phosphatase PhoE
MSTLLIVRHGQASFFSEDYDQLSPVGAEQARRLGAWWVRQGIELDQVFTGPRVRQLGTATIVGEEFRAAGRDFPVPTQLPGLDEYEAEAVLKQALPGLIERHEEVRRLQSVLAQSESRADQLRNFQKMYEVVILMWARGELDLPEIESWPDFCRRTLDTYAQITAGSGSRRVAVFTSGGPVGVAMQRALDCSLEHTLQLAWMVRNASYSEFLFSGTRFTLSSFNSFPHLDETRLLTYR